MHREWRKLFVLQQAEAFARSIGLKVDPLMINALVEAAVFSLKQWQPVKVVPVDAAATGEAAGS